MHTWVSCVSRHIWVPVILSAKVREMSNSEDRYAVAVCKSIFIILTMFHHGWNHLSDRCNKLRVIMLCKIAHHLVDIDIDDFTPIPPPNHSTCGHSERSLQLSTRINA